MLSAVAVQSECGLEVLLIVMMQCCQLIVKRLTESTPSCMKLSTTSDMSQHINHLLTVARICLACQRNIDLSELLKTVLSHLFQCHGETEVVKTFCAEITSSKLLQCQGI